MAIDGTWDLTLQSPLGPRPGTLVLAADGDALGGTLGDDDGVETLYEGAVNSGDFYWKVDIDSQVGRLTLTFNATVEDDTISGRVKFGMFGSGDFSGTRLATDP